MLMERDVGLMMREREEGKKQETWEVGSVNTSSHDEGEEGKRLLMFFMKNK